MDQEQRGSQTWATHTSRRQQGSPHCATAKSRPEWHWRQMRAQQSREEAGGWTQARAPQMGWIPSGGVVMAVTQMLGNSICCCSPPGSRGSWVMLLHERGSAPCGFVGSRRSRGRLKNEAVMLSVPKSVCVRHQRTTLGSGWVEMLLVLMMRDPCLLLAQWTPAPAESPSAHIRIFAYQYIHIHTQSCVFKCVNNIVREYIHTHTHTRVCIDTHAGYVKNGNLYIHTQTHRHAQSYSHRNFTYTRRNVHMHAYTGRGISTALHGVNATTNVNPSLLDTHDTWAFVRSQ